MTIVRKNRMLTSSGVANMLHLHINTVRRWSDKGILKPYRIGPRGDRRFMREDILNFLNSQKYAYKDRDRETDKKEESSS